MKTMDLRHITNEELQSIMYENLVGPEPNDDDFPYGNALSLHMGSCHLFAKALHDKYEYTILRVAFSGLFHYICVVQTNGENYYLDASGVTESAQELVNRLPYPETIEQIVIDNSVDLVDKYDAHGYLFSRMIIERYETIYKIN